MWKPNQITKGIQAKNTLGCRAIKGRINGIAP